MLSNQQRDRIRPLGIGGAVIAISILVAQLTPDEQQFPQQIVDAFPFADAVNNGQVWLRANYSWATRAFASVIRDFIDMVETFLILTAWPVIVLGIGLTALRFGGLRLALICSGSAMIWASIDMWDPAMETLSLMFVSILIAGILGIFLGILASQNDRFEIAIRPILDTMQTLPGFVYLLPAIFFFGIGNPPAVIAIVIYAVPPLVRLTNLGIRQVSGETVEAARSFGSTSRQLLFKVKLPLALPSITMGINQTVMMALGLVVLATFIGVGGLGKEVWIGIRRLKFGHSLEAGFAILLMTIVFDRISAAMSLRQQVKGSDTTFKLLPPRFKGQPWAETIEKFLTLIYTFVGIVSQLYAKGVATLVSIIGRPFGTRFSNRLYRLVVESSYLISAITFLVLVYLFDAHIVGIGSYPSSWEFSFQKPADAALEALTMSSGFIAITTWIRGFVFTWMLDPLADFLVGLPWWYLIALLSVGVWLFCSRGTAIVCVVGLLFIGATGLWSIGMFSMAQILVAVVLCMLIGIPLGILASVNDTFEAIIRPILDAMQTLPAFVYLIPVLMFFGGNVVSAVIAIMIYALPPVIRLTNLGIREVSYAAVEAARSFGSTFWQILFKVKIPLALPTIMMGVNQSVMMSLVMLIITPLIGGGGIGREVFLGLSQADTGHSLQAGLGIVFLAVVLDRLTQSLSVRRQAALGLNIGSH
ncbi:MAG: ABC transporter permease subunit [Pseudomonadota bacterium]|nr:ABC transporter permease subunit [Pseudomonadota bacterium]